MVQCRALSAVQTAATVKAPTCFLITSWLSSNNPLTKFTRRMLAEGPAGLKVTVSWPPDYTNQTALDFVDSITAASGDLSQAVNADFILNALGPVKVPMKSVTIIQTYAPSPPAVAQPPSPPSPLGSQPMSPEDQDTSKDPFQVSFVYIETIVMYGWT